MYFCIYINQILWICNTLASVYTEMFVSQSISERGPGNIEGLKQFTSTISFEQLCDLCKDIMHIYLCACVFLLFLGGGGALYNGSNKTCTKHQKVLDISYIMLN